MLGYPLDCLENPRHSRQIEVLVKIWEGIPETADPDHRGLEIVERLLG